MTLRKVLEDMAAKLAGAPAPASKASEREIKAFFSEVIPEYDADRFYFSHMKKVLDWYNCLQQKATLEFADDPEKVEEEQK